MGKRSIGYVLGMAITQFFTLSGVLMIILGFKGHQPAYWIVGALLIPMGEMGTVGIVAWIRRMRGEEACDRYPEVK